MFEASPSPTHPRRDHAAYKREGFCLFSLLWLCLGPWPLAYSERRYGWLEGMSRVNEEEEERRKRRGGRGEEGEEEKKRSEYILVLILYSVLYAPSSVRLYSATSACFGRIEVWRIFFYYMLSNVCIGTYVPVPVPVPYMPSSSSSSSSLLFSSSSITCISDQPRHINQIVGAWTGRQLSSLSQL